MSAADDTPATGPDAVKSNIVYAGPWTDIAAVQAYLGGLSREEVEKRVAARQLLAARFRDQELYFPTRQFRAGTTVPGLEDVLSALAEGIDSPQVWSTWLAGPADLEDVPPQDARRWWDELADGNVDRVLTDARRDASRWQH